MAKIAKETLKAGFVIVALPGTEVTASDEDIQKYGWADKIEDDGNASGNVDVSPADRPAGA